MWVTSLCYSRVVRRPRLLASVVLVCALAGLNTVTSSSANASSAIKVKTYNLSSSFAGLHSVEPDTFLDGVSCVSRNWCMLYSNTDYLIYSRGSFGKARLLTNSEFGSEDGYPISDLSCGSPTFCLASIGTDSFVYNGKTWSRVAHAGVGYADLSCVKGDVCFGELEGMIEFSRGAWRSLVFPGVSSTGLIDIACASATYCVGANNVFEYDLWNGRVWTGPFAYPNLQGNGVGSFCGVGGACVLSDGVSGYWITASGQLSKLTNWTTPNVFDGAVSCFTARFCGSLESGGHTFSVYNGARWSQTRLLATFQDPKIDCPAPSFCVAVDAQYGQFKATIFS